MLNSACVIEVRTLDVEKEPADLLEQVGRLAEEIRASAAMPKAA